MRHFNKCLYINTLVTPANAKFHLMSTIPKSMYFFCYLAPTCFDIFPIFKGLISTFLQNIPGVSSRKMVTMPKHVEAKY